jgi:hypothetical protein
MRALTLLVTAALALPLATGCGDGTEPGGDPIGDIRGISLGPSGSSLVPGEEAALRVTMYDADYNPVSFPSKNILTWTSSAPDAVSVSDTGLVRVLPGATPHQLVTIRASFGDVVGVADVFVGEPAVALHVFPGSVTRTPGGRLNLLGLVETANGDLVSRYFLRFSISGTAAHLAEEGCGITDCVFAATDRAILFGDAPGAATISVSGALRNTSVPVSVRHASFTSVTAGGHTCGVSADATLWCWGASARTPIGVSYPAGVTNIQAGFHQTCGLDPAGLAVCWPNGADPIPAPVSSSVHFTGLALAPLFSCGLDGTGAAWCWGENSWGQLGDGTKTPSAEPVAVTGGLTFSSIATGGQHACGITGTGAAYCWGMNFAGELGTSADSDLCAPYECSSAPLPVQGGHTFTRIVAGENHTCALDSSGKAWCWGFSDKRGAGPGTDTSPPAEPVPTAVAGSVLFAQLTAGPRHTCGLTSAGQAYCWGSNPDGRTGQTPGNQVGLEGLIVELSPTLVHGGHSFSQLDAGGAHTCGLAADGVYCWGDNSGGAVGVYEGNTQIPVRVTGQP